MRIPPLLLLFIILIALVLPAPAADTSDDEMLKKARNLNVTVPQKGITMLGTHESMTQMGDWLNACAASLITLIRDVTDMLGLGSTDYAKNMNQVLQTGVPPARGTTGK